mmetsp:Transcript_32711/g.69086  ORF Transcript_32711/g.69086 Transcript_32711/m.69086 type:complete len:224 (+) Transcript_32711:251-922(+)
MSLLPTIRTYQKRTILLLLRLQLSQRIRAYHPLLEATPRVRPKLWIRLNIVRNEKVVPNKAVRFQGTLVQWQFSSMMIVQRGMNVTGWLIFLMSSSLLRLYTFVVRVRARIVGMIIRPVWVVVLTIKVERFAFLIDLVAWSNELTRCTRFLFPGFFGNKELFYAGFWRDRRCGGDGVVGSRLRRRLFEVGVLNDFCRSGRSFCRGAEIQAPFCIRSFVGFRHD